MRAPRSARAAIGALFALCTILLAAAPATSAQQPSRPGGAFPKLGIAASWMRSAQVTAVADGVAAVGARAVRFDVTWSSVERVRGAYSWTHHDDVVDAFTTRGIAILGICAYSPAWANGGRDNTHPPLSAHYEDYAAFCASAARRYPQIRAWEIWNEPNNAGFWHAPNARDYTSLLRVAYRALKAVDPTLTVVSGGLSPYGVYRQSDSGGINPRTFVEQMYAAGAKRVMDAIGHHPYGGVGSASYRELGDTCPSIRSIMAANGDAGKSIWVTELGRGLQPHQPWGATTEEHQARDLTAILLDMGSRPYVGPLFWFTLADYVEPGHGLLRSDWSPRPAWAAYSLRSHSPARPAQRKPKAGSSCARSVGPQSVTVFHAVS